VGQLLLAAFSAFLGAALGAVVTLHFERTRAKGEVATATANWADDLYLNITSMAALKRRSYTAGASAEERAKYVRASDEVARLTLNSELLLKVAIAFGRGTEFQLVEGIQERCLAASRLIRRTRKTGWETSLAQAQAIMSGVDPLRSELLERLLKGATLSRLLSHRGTKPVHARGDGGEGAA
jgi:hypothetical protein